MTSIWNYILIAIIIAIILYLVRPFVPVLDLNDRTIVVSSISWMAIIYALLLTFSIQNFFNRYITIRDAFVNEGTNIQIIYRIFKLLPESNEKDQVIESIKKYSENVINVLIPSLANKKYSTETDIYYNQMDQSILNYINIYGNNIFDNNLLLRLSTSQKIKQLVNEINVGDYYIQFLIIIFILIIIPLSLSKMVNAGIQLVIDLCFLIFVGSTIYLLTILGDPFGDNPIAFKMGLYTELLDEIKEDNKNKNI